MKSVSSYAIGCKVNQYESEAIAELFEERGYNIVDINDNADIYVINTCTVTNFGDKKSRQLIRRVKRQNPNAIVVAVGCYTQTSPDEVIKIDGVNIVIGTKDKNEIVNIVEKYNEDSKKYVNIKKNYVTNIMNEKYFEPLKIHKIRDRTRAYVKIQDGCNQYCSYCIIPYARGPIRSRNINDIIDEVKSLAQNGFKEIVLTGIHIASYGKDIGNINLLDVIKLVGKIDGINRIRFSSIEPNIITEEFVLEISKISKICNHFHLSLQSGCDKTLKSMNRKYDTEKYYDSVKILRKYIPNVAITTDIIVGFPGESDYDFRKCYDFVKKIGFYQIHVFPYSQKKGTEAAKRQDQIPNFIKQKRSKELILLGEFMTNNFIKEYIGKNVEVLFEKNIGENLFEGYTKNYIKVIAKSDKNIENRILDVCITEINSQYILGNVE